MSGNPAALYTVENAHLFGLQRLTAPEHRAMQRRALVSLRPELDQFWRQVARRVIQEVVAEALPGTWLRRAEQVEKVGTPSADEAARNCRRHAWLLATQGVPDDMAAEVDEAPGHHHRPRSGGRLMTATVYNRPGEHAPPVDPPEELDLAASDDQPGVGTLWDQRPILGHIRDFALARMCAPAAVLGVVLMRTLATVPPTFVLPPIIGSHGSLNLFCALAARSGGGKGAAEAAAAAALWHADDIYTAPIGSGEGIPAQFAHREKGELVRDRYQGQFSVPEVDTLKALGAREGSTIMQQLRSAYSGEKLGFSYRDPARRLPIDEHTYRLTMVVGVQFGRASVLLDDADGGTPAVHLDARHRPHSLRDTTAHPTGLASPDDPLVTDRHQRSTLRPAGADGANGR